MEMVPFGRATGSSIGRKFSLVLMADDGRYYARMCASLLCILRQVKAVHSFPSHIFGSVLNIIFSCVFNLLKTK